MINSRFFKLFGQLREKERRQFQVFITCDLFNTNQRLRQLGACILKNWPALEKGDLDKEKLFKKAFPKKAYSELDMNNLISDLLQLLYAFLAHSELKQSNNIQFQLLVRKLLERELFDFLGPVLKKQGQLLEKRPEKNGQFFLDQFLFKEEQDYHFVAQQKRAFSQFLEEQNQSLDLFYQIEKLRLTTEMLSRSTAVNAPYQVTHLQDLLHFVEAQPEVLQQSPALQVYYHSYLMLKESEKIEHYRVLKSLLEEYIILFSAYEQRTLYSYLLNYCVRKINSGITEFYQEILDLYQRLLQTPLLLNQGKLTQWTYINIVTAGLRLRNFDWTEQFINDYKSALNKQSQENVHTYSLVSLYFEKGDYDSALQLLQSVEFTDAFYHMAAKIIQLKIYYLDEEVDAFASLILATQRFLSRNRQLSSYQKKSNNNFLKIINRLIKIQQKGPYLSSRRFEEQHGRLKKRIQETHPLGNKRWLENELEKLL